ncbi:MAG: hypothetical protein RIB58_09125 [Phycisphaerales bacterium]
MRRSREAKPPRCPRVITWRLVLLALVVGVVLAVGSVPVGSAVRWLPAYSGGSHDELEALYDPDAPAAYRRSGDWWSTRWHGDAGPSPSVETAILFARFINGQRVHASPLPAPAQAMLDGGAASVDFIGVGWPWRAAWGAIASPPSGPPGMVRGLWHPTVFGYHLQVPYFPLWPGLLGNTLFYGALALIPLALLRWHKLRRRARRGLCLACAYELGEGVEACPECGLARAG